MSLNKLMTALIVFIMFGMLATLGISWMSSIGEPESGGTGYEQHTNLTESIDIAYTGMDAILILMIAIMVFIAMGFLIRTIW